MLRFPILMSGVYADALNLQEEEIYRLNIRRTADELLTTALTPIVGDVRLNRPIPGDQKPPLRILADDELTIVWAADETAKLFDVTMIVQYEEFDPNDANSVVLKSLAWPLAKSVESIDGPNRVEPEGLEFYQFLNANIAVDPNLQRVLKNIDLRIDAGGEELFNYINDYQQKYGQPKYPHIGS